MKTLLLNNPGSLEWAERPAPRPGPREALVKVRRCGVCGTDLHALAGRQPFFSYPRCLGHELCVEIISADSTDLKAGDLCAVEAYDFCGTCPPCLAGKTNCCQNLRVLGVHTDGGHAPFMVLPVEKLHRSESLPPDAIALVEPLVIGAHGINRAAILPGEPTVILGMGPIGLAAAIFAKAAGANLVCVDVQTQRLAFATERMALGSAITADENLAANLRQHFGRMPSVVIDATGNAASMKAAFRLAEFGGRIVFLGLFIGEISFDDPDFHRRELTVMASRAGLPDDFRQVLRLMEDGRIDVLPLITHRFNFSETAERLPSLHQQPGLVKAMINFDTFCEL